MIPLAADENFNNRILRGVQRRKPELDIMRAQDAGLRGQGDDKVLAWAAAEGRVLLTHDLASIKQFVDERLDAGLPMPGVFELAQDFPIGLAIQEILILAECSLEGEWEGQIRFLPLR